MAEIIDFYNRFREGLGDGTIDLDSDTFKVILVTKDYIPDLENHLMYGDITDELLTANGYTNGGQILNNVTWARDGTTVTFNADNLSWLVDGGDLVIKRAIIYDDTAENNDLVAVIDLDDGTSEITIEDGNELQLNWNENGIFSLSS